MGDSFQYFHCKVEDGGCDDSIVDVFQRAAVYVRSASEKSGKVLVHCRMGINRSSTVAMAVLMIIEDWTLRVAFDHVKSQRACVSPFPGNMQKISAWELQSRGTCTIPTWLPEKPSPEEEAAQHALAERKALTAKLLSCGVRDLVGSDLPIENDHCI